MNMRTMFKMFFSKVIKKSLLLVTIILFCKNVSFAETYEECYSKQFQKALGLKKVYEEILIEDGVQDYDFYLSIVFPEMERYTETRDELETFFTKITYTTINDYEGCSIGPLQMKPKFAEDVELYIKNDNDLKERYPELVFNEEMSDFTCRYNRIVRLQSKKYQLLYLRAFVDICEGKYKLQNKSIENRLLVIATAYNVGLKNYEYLKKMMKNKAFPNGANSEDSRWNYADLVIHYYILFKNEEK